MPGKTTGVKGLARCDRCPMQNGRTKVSCHGAKSPDLYVIGQNPGREEALEGRNFVGASGQLTRGALKHYGMDLRRVRWGNVIACASTRSEDLNFKPMVRACLPRLIDDIRAHPPRVAVLFGDIPSKALLGSSASRIRHRYFTELAGVPCLTFATYHPARVLEDKSLDEGFDHDIRQVVLTVDRGRVPGTKRPRVNWMVSTVAGAKAMLKKALAEKVVAIDFEATGLNPFTSPVPAAILAIGLAGPKWCGSIIWSHPDVRLDQAPGAKGVLALVKRLLTSKKITKLAHNFKIEQSWASHIWGIRIAPVVDTLLVHSLLKPAMPRAIKDLAFSYGIGGYDDKMVPLKDRLWEVPWKDVARFNALDCRVCFDHWKFLTQDGGLKGPVKWLYDQVLLPNTYILSRVQATGVAIDKRRLIRFRKACEPVLEDLLTELRSKAGDSFNPLSAVQTVRFLHNKLGLPILWRTEGGAPSTRGKVLERLAARSKWARMVMEYRQIETAAHRRVDELIGYERDGLIHTLFTMAVTVTGRLSSRGPNLQNVPLRGRSAEIRRAFVSRYRGGCLLEADAEQVELRVAASLSSDRLMCRMFREGVDVHAATGRFIYRVPTGTELKPQQRQDGKHANFGVIFLIGPKKFWLLYGVPIPKARRFIHEFYRRYTGIARQSKKWSEEIRRTGQCFNIYGRPRIMHQVTTRYVGKQGEDAVRAGVAFIVQSAANDLVMDVSAEIERQLEKEQRTFIGVRDHTIHDALRWDLPRSECRPLVSVLQRAVAVVVKRTPWLTVPLVFGVKTGPDWGSMRERWAVDAIGVRKV